MKNTQAMQARRARRGENPSANWIRTHEYLSVTGRWLKPGVEFAVKGSRGRFRFIEHVETPDGKQWISAVGGTKGVQMHRAFRPEVVRRVYIKKQIMTNNEAKALVNEKNKLKKVQAQS